MSKRPSAAVWRIDPKYRPAASTSNITVRVTRAECSDGVTGHINEPTVDERADLIEITFTAAPLAPAFHTCPSNDEIARDVVLASPIGDRRLIDGSCRIAELRETVMCDQDDGVRWPHPMATGWWGRP